MSAAQPTRREYPPSTNVIPLRTKTKHPTRGRTFPPDPIRVNEVAALLGACKPLQPGPTAMLDSARLRALIVLLYRTGVRISEAVAFEERDLLRHDKGLIVQHGKGDKRRIVVMDDWGWIELEKWLMVRNEHIPPGANIPILRGATAGKRLTPTDARRQLRILGQRAGLTRRINPHAFRHGFAVELWREGLDVYTIQQVLGHARMDVTASYLRGIDPIQVLKPIGERQPPKIVIP